MWTGILPDAMTTKIRSISRIRRLIVALGLLALVATACEYRPEKGKVQASEDEGEHSAEPTASGEASLEPTPPGEEGITDPGLGPTNPPPKVSGDFALSLVAGSGSATHKDGKGREAGFIQPTGITTTPDGALIVVDSTAHRIRKVTTAGVVTTIAGSGKQGFKDGPALEAEFNTPRGVAVAKDGTIYVTDSLNHVIRAISPAGTVSTFAGSPTKRGLKNAAGRGALFNAPAGITIGPDGSLYVTEFDGMTVRLISSDAKIVRQIAGDGKKGYKDGEALSAEFDSPAGIAVDAKGVVYVADAANHRIRTISGGKVATLVGERAGFKDGSGKAALLNLPFGLTIDSDGALWVTELANNTVRKIAGSKVTTVWVSKPEPVIESSESPSPSQSKKETLQFPSGIALLKGAFYVTDTGHKKIQKLAN